MHHCCQPLFQLALTCRTFFYNLTFWLIQQCLSAQHMWLPVTPFVNPLYVCACVCEYATV